MALDEITIERIQETFDFLDDWEERFTFVLDLGRKLPPMDEAEKTEANRVHGCQATVYMKAIVEMNGVPRLVLSATSDAHIVNGLIAILVVMYSGKTPDEIMKVEAESILTGMGLEAHLSPTRRNGLHSMLKRIRQLATEHAT